METKAGCLKVTEDIVSKFQVCIIISVFKTNVSLHLIFWTYSLRLFTQLLYSNTVSKL